MTNRSIWWCWRKAIQYRTGRLYDSFFNAQYNNKYALVIGFPLLIWSIRFRTDFCLGYFIFVADEDIYPSHTSSSFFGSSWTNGRRIYLRDSATVKDLLINLYGTDYINPTLRSKTSEDPIPGYHMGLRVGCRGRMMLEDDNLAMAVRAFCKNDPKLLIWKEEL